MSFPEQIYKIVSMGAPCLNLDPEEVYTILQNTPQELPSSLRSIREKLGFYGNDGSAFSERIDILIKELSHISNKDA